MGTKQHWQTKSELRRYFDRLSCELNESGVISWKESIWRMVVTIQLSARDENGESWNSVMFHFLTLISIGSFRSLPSFWAPYSFASFMSNSFSIHQAQFASSTPSLFLRSWLCHSSGSSLFHSPSIQHVLSSLLSHSAHYSTGIPLPTQLTSYWVRLLFFY